MSNQSKTIQEKLAELGEMLAWFDSEQFAIEEALQRFKEAETLAKDIEEDLSNLKNEVIVLKKNFSEE